MKRGKNTCKILKEIRKQIAAENDIDLVISECTYKGDCKGTCPKCEAEVRYLERELEKRQRLGKAAVFAGMSLGTLLVASSCNSVGPKPLEGDVPYTPDSTEMSSPDDSIPDNAMLLEGDVVATVPDTLEAGKKSGCKNDELLEIVGEVEEENWTTTDGFVIPWTNDSEEQEVYQIVDQMPEFPGGEEALEKYINDNAKFREIINEWQFDVSGRIFVGFIVEPDGSITNVKVLRGIEKHCDEEAMRIVNSMPKWKPGMRKGEPVRVQYIVPFAIPQLQ